MFLSAVVVAGGSGARFGRLKQFDQLGAKRVIDWSVDAMLSVCEQVVVVVPHEATSELNRDDVDVAVGSSSATAGGPSSPHAAAVNSSNPTAVQCVRSIRSR